MCLQRQSTHNIAHLGSLFMTHNSLITYLQNKYEHKETQNPNLIYFHNINAELKTATSLNLNVKRLKSKGNLNFFDPMNLQKKDGLLYLQGDRVSGCS